MRKSKGQKERESTQYESWSPPVYSPMNGDGGVVRMVKTRLGVPCVLAACPRRRRQDRKAQRKAERRGV
jgi:hypothetical protein